MLSGRIQTQKDKCHTILLIHGICKKAYLIEERISSGYQSLGGVEKC
jgi:hypothetical protein